MKNFLKCLLYEAPGSLVYLAVDQVGQERPSRRVSEMVKFIMCLHLTAFLAVYRELAYLHLRERSLMVVTEAVMLGSDSLQILSPSLILLTLVLMIVRMAHSTWCSDPLLHSLLHTSRLHREQN